MIQGRNMEGTYTGMRKGISLVEMMIAIILFGVISIIGFKYSSNFYDTKLASKKALVASLVEQGTQLSNAYDIYSIQFGVAPTDETNLTQANVQILSAIPTTITEIGTIGWNLNLAIDADNDTVADDYVFEFDVAGTTADSSEYCAVLNNIVTTSVDLNTTLFPLATYNSTTSGTAFCYGSGVGGAAPYKMVFVKEIN